MIKRKIQSILAVILTFAMLSTTVLAAGFPDMPNDWSTPALEHAVKNGLLKGDGGYIKPNDDLTRAQMAAIINRVFGATVKASLSSYADVPSGTWYYDDMAKAVHMGVFAGSGFKLEPERNITRQEAFLVLARAFKLPDGDPSALDRFADKGSVSDWASGAVSALFEAGYVGGSDGYIRPTYAITRVEFAKLIDSLVKTYFTAQGTYTSVTAGNVMINVPDVTLKGVTVTGDLIIGDGVGDGTVTLDNVTVTGRTVVRGGGIHSLRIMGTSNLQNIIIARVDGEVRVYAEDGTEIGQVIVDGKDNVIIEGTVGTVTVEAVNVTVTASNADITTAAIEGENSKIVVDTGSKVSTLTVDAPNGSVNVAGQVKNVVVNGEGTTIDGGGKVDKVTANADNVAVSTPNTDVAAASGTTGVTAGKNTVAGGSNVNTSPASVIPAFVPVTAITSVSPNAGPIAGGTVVTIIGALLTGATTVTFGGMPATSFTVDSATQITATAPAHAAGTFDVTVTTAGGTATSTNGYTYIAAPTIAVISPNYGSDGGGTVVTITGTNFTGAPSVTFGVTPATDVTVVNGTTITAKTPAHAGGIVTVSVTTPGGTATCTGGYAYSSLLGSTIGGSGSYADGERISFDTSGTPRFAVPPKVFVSAYDASGNPLVANVTAVTTSDFILQLWDQHGNSVTSGATVYWAAFS